MNKNHTFKQYAVLGNPISHSLSPSIHGEFAKQLDIDMNYDARLIENTKFESSVKQFFLHGGGGLNITLPFKIKACELADKNTQRAKFAGAANTFYMNDKGQLLADNTDGVGLITDIKNNHKFKLQNKNILILGAGGAVRGVLELVLNENPKQVVICNRTHSKATKLVDFFNANSHSKVMLLAQDINHLNDTFDLIINGTSSSLSGQIPKIPDSVFTSETFVYDMMYSLDESTNFTRWVKEKGVICAIDGLGMLVEQAAESFRIWHNVKPDTSKVITFLRRKSIREHN